MQGLLPHVCPQVEAALACAGLDDWLGEGEGKGSLPLQFMASGGWVELMRLAPGTRMARHRHRGEVHGFHLQGWRQLADGRLLGPGAYAFEPAGQVDHWAAAGAQPLVLQVVVLGDVDYVDEQGGLLRRITMADRLADYRAACARRGLAAPLMPG
ncbi:MAG: anti-sigma factor [Roseateles depolymerans]|uniref:Anti-sigma factor n=1 Tax=Roseateles depolymerans TaxID=76731 RepID=A0A2W5FJE1_9BURK|nr:MAG: anti-sigma factor [Roseateles depolymerans]